MFAGLKRGIGRLLRSSPVSELEKIKKLVAAACLKTPLRTRYSIERFQFVLYRVLNSGLQTRHKERKILSLAFAAGLIFTIAASVMTSSAYSDQISGEIANELVRFHVRAHSDSEIDQQLKEYVRESVLDYLRDGLSSSSSKSETCELLYSRLGDVKSFAERIIRESGFDYSVETSMTREFFPTRVYGDIALPAGEYDTLRIDIGNAAGRNWWCVLFPPLCYVDITRKEIPLEEKDVLRFVLSDESYGLITKGADGDDPEVRIRFKTVELWQSLKAGMGLTAEAAVGGDAGGDNAAALPITGTAALGPQRSGELLAGRTIQQQTVEPLPDPSEDEERSLWLLACVINGEARGEQYDGQVAVGAVVLNRVAHPSFPDTIEEVIYQPGAFDAVRDGQINLTPSESCMRAAREALSGSDPTDGALYYWNPKTATCRWINNISVTMAIGNHNFGMH